MRSAHAYGRRAFGLTTAVVASPKFSPLFFFPRFFFGLACFVMLGGLGATPGVDLLRLFSGGDLGELYVVGGPVLRWWSRVCGPPVLQVALRLLQILY
eukprot:m.263795 g.263795  ORF g.263795 m.263795 type:complete len:98 (+) comp26717_c0_seq4:1078-1371(+)